MTESEERIDVKPGAGCGRAMLVVVGLGVAIGLLWAVLGDSSSESKGPDSGAQLACSHFANVADDAAAGVITPDELRGKIQEVEDDAQYSDEPGVATSARAMLAAITPPVDAEAYAVAVDDFIAACNASAD